MKTETIAGKKILFFAPAFFHYEKMIAEKMRTMGAEVDMYDVRSVTSAFERALLKISPRIFEKKSLRYYNQIISGNKGKQYDYILIVKCDMTPIPILKKFREIYPNAKLCLMLWDSVKNIPGITEKFDYFDTIHSFDSDDCSRYPQLQLRPLFYGDSYCRPLVADEKLEYDICFIGTIHSDRLAIIRQIEQICKQNGLRYYWFMYLQSSFIYYFYKLLKKEFRGLPRDTFAFQQMSAKEIAGIVESSKIILDIQHPRQTGLTMRTLEVLGMQKKLITTNADVKNYDFYDPNNIQVVDRNCIRLDTDFLTKPYRPVQDEVYQKYSLSQWILDALS